MAEFETIRHQISSKREKKEAKSQLLEQVLTWIIANEPDAKAEFADSAREVIALLREIERVLFTS